MTGILLAGGKSARFGTNKAFALYRGKPFYRIILDKLETRCEEVLISSNQPEEFTGTGHSVIPDKVQGRGPLGGLVTLFHKSTFPWVLVMACDMPQIKEESLDFLLDLMDQEKKLICYQEETRLQPFPGLYHRSLIDALYQWLSNGNNQVEGFIQTLPSDEKQIIASTSLHKSRNEEFFNVNTKEEYLTL